ncbi:hypothetical protein C8N35_11513 [Breoghania corrubedonensis]|uniref:Uncharacterized protein n=1 Tax=Breoghania corrubedonensis TaxID=665038 RepID=A0A2T5UQY5_9HYPH|nr:hypothetical protein [Breoghania corrubedonensis]PTW53893.1 hypothetical protein C8N35_11513 [Breoghania corrubedonensis]
MTRILHDRTTQLMRDAAALAAALPDLVEAHPEGVGTVEVMGGLDVSPARASAAMHELVFSRRCAFSARDGYLLHIWPAGGLPPMTLAERRMLLAMAAIAARDKLCGEDLVTAAAEAAGVGRAAKSLVTRLALKGVLVRGAAGWEIAQ